MGSVDTLNVQLYGNETASYVLKVGCDGRINFPKLGPMIVAGLSFDGARASIEQHVSQRLIGTRVRITMGNMRSIRVFVRDDAHRLGSYTVSDFSRMTKALFASEWTSAQVGDLRT